jgi:hypothetical protein
MEAVCTSGLVAWPPIFVGKGWVVRDAEQRADVAAMVIDNYIKIQSLPGVDLCGFR